MRRSVQRNELSRWLDNGPEARRRVQVHLRPPRPKEADEVGSRKDCKAAAQGNHRIYLERNKSRHADGGKSRNPDGGNPGSWVPSRCRRFCQSAGPRSSKRSSKRDAIGCGGRFSPNMMAWGTTREVLCVRSQCSSVDPPRSTVHSILEMSERACMWMSLHPAVSWKCRARAQSQNTSRMRRL